MDITQIILFYGGSAVVLALLGGWWLTRRAFAPVAALTLAAEKIHERNLAEKLPRSGNGDELDRLTEVFNAMTARLDGSFQRIREFTLHASHELKTPLTVLHGELETALHDGHSAAGATRKTRRPARRNPAADQNRGRPHAADQGRCRPDRVEFRAGGAGRNGPRRFADAQILAAPANISVRLDACEEITVNGDRHRLRQLLLNLADNAVKYNQPGGTVEFSLRRTARRPS